KPPVAAYPFQRTGKPVWQRPVKMRNGKLPAAEILPLAIEKGIVKIGLPLGLEIVPLAIDDLIARIHNVPMADGGRARNQSEHEIEKAGVRLSATVRQDADENRDAHAQQHDRLANFAASQERVSDRADRTPSENEGS